MWLLRADFNDRSIQNRESVSHEENPTEEQWQHEILSHAPEYGAEFAGTVFLVFCAVVAVAIMFAPASPVLQIIPSTRLRLFVTGAMLGGAGGLVAITQLGRMSGAHLNPAISLGFFAEGKMQLQDVFGYIVAQLGGGIAGAWAGAAATRGFGQSVHEAVNVPGGGVSDWAAVGAEVVGTFTLAFIIFEMVSSRRWMRWTPLVVIGVASVIVGIDGNFSGASLNPARSFGPAWLENQWGSFWVYVLGPCTGGLLAGVLHRVLPRGARTGKLFHDLHYRSIFTGCSDKASNTHVRRHAGARSDARPSVNSNRP